MTNDNINMFQISIIIKIIDDVNNSCVLERMKSG